MSFFLNPYGVLLGIKKVFFKYNKSKRCLARAEEMLVLQKLS